MIKKRLLSFLGAAAITAALTFAICMSERMPSCMRAPPETV